MAHKSIYNYFFKRAEQSYRCFNTLKGSLVVFDKKTKKEFDASPQENISIDTAFKEKLLELGFLCDDSEDEFALNECKKLGMKKVGINCNDNNIASKKVIKKNGGKLLFNYGESSRYEIKL